jgi:hypothetical protein
MKKLSDGKLSFYAKNPDLRIGELYWEEESSHDFSNIASRISSGAKQSNNVIISYNDNMNESDFKKKIFKKFKEHSNLERIEIRANNKKVVYTR